MPNIDVTVQCPVYDSFRVQQVAGMFDVPLSERLRESFQVEVPDESEPWSIGLVVGPSGSGKSTIARECFGRAVYERAEWPADRAVIDAIGDIPSRQATRLFTAVGFSSPPSWVKPYRVLSGGERFRCDLARALAQGGGSEPSAVNGQESSSDLQSPGANQQPPDSTLPVVVFDEFTSVVDRQVAKATSAAIAKGIRSGHIPCRFVAVSCHYDIASWLQPDWIVDMAAGRLDRRRLRRPAIRLQIRRCHRNLWRRFARHHYLSGSLAPTARCYAALWAPDQPAANYLGDAYLGDGDEQSAPRHEPPQIAVPVCFCATLPIIGRQRHWRFTRIVTLPDYQGLGVGMRSVEAIAQMYRDAGLRINVTTSHPALVEHGRASPKWRVVGVNKQGRGAARRLIPGYRGSAGRCVVSLEYVGEGAMSGEQRAMSSEP